MADLFGFHALQLGLPQLDGLRANRMPHRWVAGDSAPGDEPLPDTGAAGHEIVQLPPDDAAFASPPLALCCDFDALPFDSQSLDLVVMPHTLELARDPHQALREVERVLMPEGRVVILGFNPASLWGLRQRLGHVKRGLGLGRQAPLFLPRTGDFIGYRRLRDWLRLLSFEVEAGRFGCYRPPLRSEPWMARFAWTEPWGDRWWPVFGAVYSLTAVKRVRGMRLIGLVRDAHTAPKAARAVVTHRGAHHELQEHER